MTDREILLTALESMGRADALDLRQRAAGLDGTALIDQEAKIPDFDPKQDYSTWPQGSPVRDEDQVWTLLQPHNAAHYPGRPSALRTLWGLCHTKDPAKAKAWVPPLGTSGMYMKGECCQAEDGTVYRAKQDNLVHDAQALPSAWEPVRP